jgi:hypothetical protein
VGASPSSSTGGTISPARAMGSLPHELPRQSSFAGSPRPTSTTDSTVAR